MAVDKNRFSKKTRETLAKRAGQICSKPGCGKRTVGPSQDQKKSIDVGEAAHIRGANPGAARYYVEMTPVERSCITNGIWLCRTCAKLIDSDEAKYTVSVLYRWKQLHEAEIERQVDGTSMSETLLATDLYPFQSEPPAARQVALDRPDLWECLLVIELLRPKLGEILADLTDLDRGLTYRPAKYLGLLEFTRYFQELMYDTEQAVTSLSVALDELCRLCNPSPSDDKSPIMILRVCNHVVCTCRNIFVSEAQFRAVIFPEELSDLKQYCEGWSTSIIHQIKHLVDSIVDGVEEVFEKASRGDTSPTIVEEQAVLELPEQFKQFTEKMFSRQAELLRDNEM